MNRFIVSLCATCALIGLLTMSAVADTSADFEISIKVSPNAIVLDSEGAWVTVHTDIALSAVDTATLTLNGIPVAWTKADAKGNLVAKLHQSDMKSILEPPQALLELAGSTKDGTRFAGSDTVRVK